MKKFILLLSVISFIAFTGFGQGLSGGIKAGVNFSNESYSSSSITFTPDGLVGFNGGLYLKAMLTEKIGIQPELLYSVQGSTITLFNTKVDNKYSYLNIPVLFRYNIIPLINVHAGPQLGINLSADQKSGGNSASFKNDVNTADFAVAFGAGFDLPVGFNGGIRYNLGLSNTAKNATNGETAKHTVFQIYVGMRLFGAK